MMILTMMRRGRDKDDDDDDDEEERGREKDASNLSFGDNTELTLEY